jgi:hypothetical protein
MARNVDSLAPKIGAGLLGPAVAAAVGMAGADAGAQTAAEKVELAPAAAVYLVLKDANIRELPETKSRRTGSIKEGERIESEGKAKGTEWVSVSENGKVTGFVYAPVLAATIDGTLKQDLNGETDLSPGPRCRHRVRFEGKSRVEGEPLETSDYQVAFQCRHGGRDVTFDAAMFITEIPYLSSRKDVYQINIDIPEIATTVEQVLSVTVMYHPGNAEAVFDTVSASEMASDAPTKSRPARTVPEALNAAVAIAISAWGAPVWERLADPKATAEAETAE